MPTSRVRGPRAPFWIPVLALALLAPPAGAAEALPDSTIADRWTLSNGLTVLTRHTPRMPSVSITMSYAVGSSHDPVGREGLARLLGELAFLGGAGDATERTREDLASQRPAGWNLRVAPHSTQLTEIAAHATFPGVLHQVAARARGVQVTEALLRRATDTVKRDLADRYAQQIDLVLYYHVRALAEGALPDRVSRYGSGKGIEKLPLAEARERLATLFVPANAVLAIAGNLSGYDVRRMVETQFGAIPAGSKATLPEPHPLQPGARVTPLASARASWAVVGVIAPPLTDSLHPSFCVNSLLIGSFLRNRWTPPEAPLTTRFEYSLVDEPDLVRLYAPVRQGADSIRAGEELVYAMSELPVEAAGPEAYRDVLDHVEWLLGGPIPPPMIRRMLKDPTALHTLSSSMAARAHRGDDDFWGNYRARLREAADLGFSSWPRYFIGRDHQAEVRIVPPGK